VRHFLLRNLLELINECHHECIHCLVLNKNP
jgi:hypothetical protein